jgi:hypothetical protein
MVNFLSRDKKALSKWNNVHSYQIYKVIKCICSYLSFHTHLHNYYRICQRSENELHVKQNKRNCNRVDRRITSHHSARSALWNPGEKHRLLCYHLFVRSNILTRRVEMTAWAAQRLCNCAFTSRAQDKKQICSIHITHAIPSNDSVCLILQYKSRVAQSV